MTKSTHSKQYKHLCVLLIQRRKELGLSQYDLADLLQRPQSFVAKVEGGERRLDVAEFLELAHALSSDPCEIIRTIDVDYTDSVSA